MDRLAKLSFLEKFAGPRLPRWLADKSATHYQVLGLDKFASARQINIAFFLLAATWRPDLCVRPEAREIYGRITLAHEVLSHPIERPSHPAIVAYQRTIEWNLRGPGAKVDIGV